MTMYTDQDIADAWRAAVKLWKDRDPIQCGRAFLAALAPHPAEFGAEDDAAPDAAEIPEGIHAHASRSGVR